MGRRSSLGLVLIMVLICALVPARAAEPGMASARNIPPAMSSSLMPRGLASPTPTPDDLTGIPPEARAKIDRQLLEQLLQREQSVQLQESARPTPVTYLVYLWERAALQGLARVPHLPERRGLLVRRLQATAQRSQMGIVSLLERNLREGRVARYKSYWIFNGLVVSGDLATAVQLALSPEVEAIRPNRVHRLPAPIRASGALASAGEVEWNISKIGADQVWEDFGITGQGIVVANMDSGVDWTHPALQRKYRGYNAPSGHNHNWFDFTGTYPDQPGPREYGVGNRFTAPT